MEERTSWVRRMPKLALTALGALVLSLCMGVAIGAESRVVENDVREYRVGPPAASPEGVVYAPGQRAFYGGSVEDGTLYRATLGDRTAATFLPANRPAGRNSAIGVNADDGLLYVAGGDSGRLYVYSLRTKREVARFRTGSGGFINDVTITREGDVYFTDSIRPFLYRVTEDQVENGGGAVERIRLTPEVRYQQGFNVNGIRDTASGQYIIIADSNDNALYRVEPAGNPEDREIRRVRITGRTANPDGLELRGHILYVVDNTNELIVKVRLGPEFARGDVKSNTTTPEFHTPTTASIARGRLLVSNPEFNDQSEPGAPYFVVSIPRP